MKNLILAGALLLSLSVSSAQERCVTLFLDANPVYSLLAKKPVPVGLVNAGQNTVPVLLANKLTAPFLDDLYNRSLGIVVAHQNGYRNDHGLFRLGQYFIDRDSPGYRNRGEIHQTGISWVPVKGYVDYSFRRNEAYNRIEVLFHLEESEWNTTWIYQKMRRAALIRPDFSFGGARNPDKANNRLANCGEICFSFSTGSGASEQAQAIARELRKSGIDLQALMKDAEVLKFIDEAKGLLQRSDLSENGLNPQMLTQLDVPQAVQIAQPNKSQQLELLNWLVGYQVSVDYAELLYKLQIHNSSDFSNYTSTRATAVVIYDANTTPELFLKPEYQSQGVFSTWENDHLTIIQEGKSPEVQNKILAPILKLLNW